MSCEDTTADLSSYLFCPYDGQRLSNVPDTPGGTCTRCGFVDYGNPKPCVAVLVEKDGGVLLARRAIEPGRGCWDVPGGFVEPGETTEEAVIREIFEETGLHLKDVRYLMSIPDTYGERQTPTLNLCYTAVPVNWPPELSEEALEFALFLPDDLPSDLAFPHEKRLLDTWMKEFVKRHPV